MFQDIRSATEYTQHTQHTTHITHNTHNTQHTTHNTNNTQHTQHATYNTQHTTYTHPHTHTNIHTHRSKKSPNELFSLSQNFMHIALTYGRIIVSELYLNNRNRTVQSMISVSLLCLSLLPSLYRKHTTHLQIQSIQHLA